MQERECGSLAAWWPYITFMIAGVFYGLAIERWFFMRDLPNMFELIFLVLVFPVVFIIGTWVYLVKRRCFLWWLSGGILSLSYVSLAFIAFHVIAVIWAII